MNCERAREQLPELLRGMLRWLKPSPKRAREHGKREILISAFCLSVLVASCNADYGEPKLATSAQLSIESLAEEPERYAGQSITLEGVFTGWRATDCRFPVAASPALTRSDWLLKTGEVCLYVTGGIPADLEPMDPEDLGRRLELKADVLQTDEGKVYLKYLDGRPLGP